MSIDFAPEYRDGDRGLWDLMPRVNLSNQNGAQVLGSLGVEVDWEDIYGEFDPTDFSGRVLLARALEPADEGTPDEVSPSGRFVDCGRPQGYLETVLDELGGLAAWCADHGRKITFNG